MKNSMVLAVIALMFSLAICASDLNAMRLEPADGTVVSSSAAMPKSDVEGLASDGETLAWFDNRVPAGWDPDAGAASVYGMTITDSGLSDEFLIDQTQYSAYGLRVAGKWAAYIVTVPGQELQQMIHLIDISAPAAPIVYSVDTGEIVCSRFAITEQRLLVPKATTNPDDSRNLQIYALDLTQLDGSKTALGLKDFTLAFTLPENISFDDLALYGTTMIWSGYDSNPDEWHYTVGIYDFANPEAGPNLVPYHGEGVFSIKMNSSRIVFNSWMNADGLFAFHNYADIENSAFTPAIVASNYDSWSRNANALGGSNTFAIFEGQESQSDSQSSFIKGGVFAYQNKCINSTLLTRTKSNYETPDLIGSLATNPEGDRLYWVEYNQDTAVDEYEIRTAEVILECGDWGYHPADISRNCRVDLADFSMMADQWLDCTMPGESGCMFGSFITDETFAAPTAPNLDN